MSGETAAIGLGFLLGGPVGAIIGGTVAPAALAALMWRSRKDEHDQNSNGDANGSGTDRSGRGTSGGSGSGNRGRNNAAGGNGRGKGPNSNSGLGGTGKDRKPKTKDPILDKLSKGLDKLKPKKSGGDLAGPKNKNPKDLFGSSKDGKGPKAPKGGTAPKGGGADGTGSGGKSPKDSKSRKWLKDRGPQPNSPRPWAGRGDKPEKPKKNRKGKGADDDTTSSTARDGLDPKGPKGGSGDGLPPKPDYDPDEVVDAELVDDDLPPKPPHPPGDVIDAEVIDEDRIALVRKNRERKKRRQAIKAAQKAADKAARAGQGKDPREVKAQVIREENRRIDLEIHHENDCLALATATEERRSRPVNYPAVQAAPAGTRQAGAAIARQLNPRTSSAYAILRAMADQLAHGTINDDEADMADHIVELSGIPNMCKNLSVAVREAAEALRRTGPLHPTVIKHLNNAAIAARTAGVMSENIVVVLVQAHREDIFRVLEPRIGEERWNIRNAQGTLDGAKLRAAILSSGTRNALPSGTPTTTGNAVTNGGSKLVPASDASTKRLIALMKGFTRGHMVNVLSEVAGSATGVDAVADSVGKLVSRMRKTWPTESIVDDTVARTQGQVRKVSTELHKAVKAAKKLHARELKLNAKGRAGKGARAERKWDVLNRRGNG